MFHLFSHLLLFSSLIYLHSCKPSKQKEDGKVSLYKYGIPVFLSLPDDVVFVKGSSGNVESLTITNSSGFNMQVMMFPASFSNANKAKFYQRELIVNNPDFKKIVEDYDSGFLFELSMGGNIVYDFRSVKVVGNKEIIFQAGPTCECSESNVRKMLAVLQ